MFSGNGHAKPDEREKRIRQPVFPAEILRDRAVRRRKVQPDIQKFVDTNSGEIVGSKTVCPKVFFSDVIVSFKRRDRPAHRPVGNQSSGSNVCDSYVFAGHDSFLLRLFCGIRPTWSFYVIFFALRYVWPLHEGKRSDADDGNKKRDKKSRRSRFP